METIPRIADSFRRWLGYALLMVGFFTLAACSARADVMPGRVLAKLQWYANINDINAAYGTSVVQSDPGSNRYELICPNGSESSIAQQLSSDSRVVYAETETVFQIGFGADQLGFSADAATADQYVQQSAWQEINLIRAQSLSRGAGVIVAVLDTGTSFNHPALAGHYVYGFNAINPGTAPVDAPDSTSSNSAVGHGTMVSGIIARIAPAAKIMPIKVLDGDGSGTTLTIIEGIRYAVWHGADVITMSFGANSSSQCLLEAVEVARACGILLVASAGNDNSTVPHYPAAYNMVMSVTSVEADNTKSLYANYGTYIDLVAPGSGVSSTFWDGTYATSSGTSFAAPMVAAEIALVKSRFWLLTPYQVRRRIEMSASSVNSVNPDYAGLLGNGIININAALHW